MTQKGFTLIEVLLGLAIFILMLAVAARNSVSINEFYKERRLVQNLAALREALQDYYTAQGSFSIDITSLSPYLPDAWINESPFGYSYILSVTGSVAHIDTTIPDTINLSYLPYTGSYAANGVKYVRTEIIVPHQNLNARWERKHIYETCPEGP